MVSSSKTKTAILLFGILIVFTVPIWLLYNKLSQVNPAGIDPQSQIKDRKTQIVRQPGDLIRKIPE